MSERTTAGYYCAECCTYWTGSHTCLLAPTINVPSAIAEGGYADGYKAGRAELAAIIAERDGAVSIATQLERERDALRASLNTIQAKDFSRAVEDICKERDAAIKAMHQMAEHDGDGMEYAQAHRYKCELDAARVALTRIAAHLDQQSAYDFSFVFSDGIDEESIISFARAALGQDKP